MTEMNTEQMIARAEEELKELFSEIDRNEEARTRQILQAFREEGVSYRHFSGTTGYGYDDIGRDTIERIYARIFHTEAGLMRPHIASGTAALSLTLFGLTGPGEHIVSATGMPYDTLLNVIGIGKKQVPGSLKDMGVSFDCAEMKDGRIDRTGTVAEIFQSEYLKKLFDARSDAFDTTYGFMTPSGPQRANASPRVCVGNRSSRVKRLMVQGTMSSAGKSLIVAGLCRILRQDGFRVAPFKSQNMALNSFVTEDGLEMGRAQVMQAEACGIKPSVLMNPILLKPTDDCGSQVIVNGAVVGNMRAREYFEYKTRLTPTILSAVDAPVLLVGDIDRGGVFAQLLGTLELLEPDERARVKGLIVNKFRGDKTILDPGVAELEKRGGVPVAGVIPYMTLTLADEDSLTERFERRGRGLVNIGVVQLSHLSNFTDFDVFEQVKGVAVTYVKRPEETRGFDLLILPGSKNTIADVRRLRESGFESAIRAYAESGAPVIGVCGGFQALGETIADPDGVEGGGSIAGLGLLPVATTLRTQKRRRQTTGSFVAPDGPLASLAGLEFSGYEIHMGETVATRAGTSEFTSGATGLCRGNIYGTYVHGVFDGESVVKTLIATLASRKGVAVDLDGVVDYRTLREREYDRLAATMREHLNMALIYDALGVERHD